MRLSWAERPPQTQNAAVSGEVSFGDGILRRGGRLRGICGEAAGMSTSYVNCAAAARAPRLTKEDEALLVFPREASAPCHGSPSCCTSYRPRPRYPQRDSRPCPPTSGRRLGFPWPSSLPATSSDSQAASCYPACYRSASLLVTAQPDRPPDIQPAKR